MYWSDCQKLIVTLDKLEEGGILNSLVFSIFYLLLTLKQQTFFKTLSFALRHGEGINTCCFLFVWLWFETNPKVIKLLWTLLIFCPFFGQPSESNCGSRHSDLLPIVLRGSEEAGSLLAEFLLNLPPEGWFSSQQKQNCFKISIHMLKLRIC